MKHFLRLVAVLLVIAAAPARAGYPERTVHIVVPYPPGGTPDILGRLLAARLTERLHQPFVIENHAGGSGVIGTEKVLTALPDGYMLMMGSVQTHGMNPSMFRSLPYDPINGSTAITEVAESANVLVVNPTFAAKDVKSLIAMAKAKPGALNFGSTSIGGTPHLSGELLKLKAGIDIVHVPYKGSGPMLADLLAGHIPMAFDNLPASMVHIRSGKIRALAVTTSRRSPSAPDIPTFEESGLKDFDLASWFGLFGPAKLPVEVVSTIHSQVAAILQEPATRARFEQIGAMPVGSTPDEFAEHVRREIAKFREIVRAAKMEPR